MKAAAEPKVQSCRLKHLLAAYAASQILFTIKLLTSSLQYCAWQRKSLASESQWQATARLPVSTVLDPSAEKSSARRPSSEGRSLQGERREASRGLLVPLPRASELQSVSSSRGSRHRISKRELRPQNEGCAAPLTLRSRHTQPKATLPSKSQKHVFYKPRRYTYSSRIK